MELVRGRQRDECRFAAALCVSAFEDPDNGRVTGGAVDHEHHRARSGRAQQWQAGLGEPPARRQPDVQRAPVEDRGGLRGAEPPTPRA